MLGYLEQLPLYNAINFSWGPLATKGTTTSDREQAARHQYDGHPHPDQFIRVPLRSLLRRGQQDINDYASCFGTTGLPLYNWNATDGPPLYNQKPSGSTGMFTFALAYGVRNCTDGTSNTVAYAEWLVGGVRGAGSAARIRRAGTGVRCRGRRGRHRPCLPSTMRS